MVKHNNSSKMKNEFGKMINFIEGKYTIIFIMVLLSYFAYNFVGGVIKGGRWDLYQQMAMADRLLAGKGFYYSIEEASSPYFPGVAFLAVVVGWIFSSYRDFAMLFIASAVGTGFLGILIKLGERFSGNKYVSLATTSFLLFCGFGRYKSYMNEFKADTIILTIGILLIFLITIEKNDSNIKKFVFIFGVSLVMDVFKQHALYIDVAIGIYLLFLKGESLKNKINILGSMIGAGVLAMIIIFSIPGSRVLTVENLRCMPFFDLKHVLMDIKETICQNIFFLVLALWYLFLLVTKKTKLVGIEKPIFLVAIIYGCAQIMGGMKIGGNAGNYEVGMVLFVPYTVIAMNHIVQMDVMDRVRNVLIALLNSCVLLASVFVLAFTGIRLVPAAIERVQTDKEISNYLSETMGGERFMYYSNQYMQLEQSIVEPGMDLLSAPYFVEEYWGYRAEKIQSREYKYIYIQRDELESEDIFLKKYVGYDAQLCTSLDENYYIFKDDNMPSSIVGQIYVAR